MAAWGISNFENDTALKWVEEVTQNSKNVDLKKELTEFLQGFDSEETTLVECERFLVIAEVFAALIGSASEDAPEELLDWILLKYTKIESVALKKVISGVELILKDSEAKEMYLDTEYFKAWERVQKDLIKRLNS